MFSYELTYKTVVYFIIGLLAECSLQSGIDCVCGLTKKLQTSYEDRLAPGTPTYFAWLQLFISLWVILFSSIRVFPRIFIVFLLGDSATPHPAFYIRCIIYFVPLHNLHVKFSS